MSPRVTLILAIVVAALGVFVWLYEVEGADKRADAEQTAKQIFPELEAADLTELTLRTSDDQTVHLARGEEGWRLTAPLDVPADAAAANGAAAALADLVTESVYEDPEALENYGLAGEPTVTGKVGDQSFALLLGDRTPTRSNTYVAQPGDPRVYTVASYRTYALKKSLDDLRDARILSFDRAAVTGIEVTWQGSGVKLAKGETGWRLREPLDAPADQGTLEGLLSDLGFLRAEAYRDTPDEETTAALDTPAYRVVLRGEGDEPLAELAVAAAGDSQRRAVRGREGLVYEIAESRFGDFPRTLVAFRFKELTRFSSADANRFELSFQDGDETLTVTGTKDDKGTWTGSPEALVPGKARRLISELSSLEAQGIAAEAMGADELAGLGLAPPNALLRVRVAGEEGAEDTVLAELRLGRLEVGRGIAAQRPDDPIVYWLEEGLAEHLPVSLEAFRNRFVAEEEPVVEAATDEVAEEEPVVEASTDEEPVVPSTDEVAEEE